MSFLQRAAGAFVLGTSRAKLGLRGFKSPVVNYVHVRDSISSIYYMTKMSRTLSSEATREHKQQPNEEEKPRKIPVPVVIILVSAVGLHFVHKLFRQNTKAAKTSSDTRQEVHKDPHSAVTLVKCGQFWLPTEFVGSTCNLDVIRDFHVRMDDIVVASFPKSGTTWLQEIIYLIMNDMDLQKASESTIEDRFPYLEYIHPGLQALTKLRGQRLMKTHLPLELLPQGLKNGKGKLVYIARNPKDVSVSYYHFMKMVTFSEYRGEFHDFFEAFKEGKVAYGPWNAHVAQYWENRNEKNIFFLTYEDLHKRPKETLRKLSAFLEKPDISDRQLDLLVNHCAFSNMRDNPKVNYSWWEDIGLSKKDQSNFMRKGRIGDWTNYFSQQMSNEFDRTLLSPVQEKGLSLEDRP